MGIKLAALMAAAAITEVKFRKITVDVSSKGTKTAILYLETPIENVKGSQYIENELTGQKERLEEWDVLEVKVNEADAEDEGFDVNEDGSGIYKGEELKLDVSQKGEVWLTSKLFSEVGNDSRREARVKKNISIADRLKARREAKGIMSTATSTSDAKPNLVGETVK